MNFRRVTPVFVAFAGTLLLAACDSSRPPSAFAPGGTQYLEPLGGSRSNYAARSAAAGPVDNVSFWDGGAAQGSPSIVISLGEQKAKFYRGGTLVGVSQISSGREGYNTPTGSYKILQKNADHASNLYGVWKASDGTVINDDVDVRKQPNPPPGTRFVGAPMPYFMRITNGGVGMHAGYLPGFPASHGCIRMPEWMARHFFHNISLGTPVRVEY